jgi:hypothetical protein
VMYATALALLMPCATLTAAKLPNSAKQNQAPQALGSISAVGSVSVNGVPALPDATIFVGDTIRTSDSGAVSFSLSGKGAFKIAPNSEMSFLPDPRFTGELKSGMVVMNSFGGATDISVRVGNFVVAPVIQAQQSASRIERHSDGSFAIACLDGSVGLIPLEGATGRVLQSGESANILPSGELEQARVVPTPEAPPKATDTTTTATNTPPPEPPPVHGNSSKKNEYILLGVAGAAAVGIAAGLAGRGHGSPSVSPSTP